MATQISKTQGGHPRQVNTMTPFHQVKPGETLESVANLYGISPADLVARNGHTLGAKGIHQGQRLVVGL